MQLADAVINAHLSGKCTLFHFPYGVVEASTSHMAGTAKRGTLHEMRFDQPCC